MATVALGSTLVVGDMPALCALVNDLIVALNNSRASMAYEKLVNELSSFNSLLHAVESNDATHSIRPDNSLLTLIVRTCKRTINEFLIGIVDKPSLSGPLAGHAIRDAFRKLELEERADQLCTKLAEQISNISMLLLFSNHYAPHHSLVQDHSPAASASTQGIVEVLKPIPWTVKPDARFNADIIVRMALLKNECPSCGKFPAEDRSTGRIICSDCFTKFKVTQSLIEHTIKAHTGTPNTEGLRPIEAENEADDQQFFHRMRSIMLTSKSCSVGLVDLDRQCGVVEQQGLACAHSFICKVHSLDAKRAVKGRSRLYDDLLLDWQRMNGTDWKETVESKTEGGKNLNAVVPWTLDDRKRAAEMVSRIITNQPQPEEHAPSFLLGIFDPSTSLDFQRPVSWASSLLDPLNPTNMGDGTSMWPGRQQQPEFNSIAHVKVFRHQEPDRFHPYKRQGDEKVERGH